MWVNFLQKFHGSIFLINSIFRWKYSSTLFLHWSCIGPSTCLHFIAFFYPYQQFIKGMSMEYLIKTSINRKYRIKNPNLFSPPPSSHWIDIHDNRHWPISVFINFPGRWIIPAQVASTHAWPCLIIALPAQLLSRKNECKWRNTGRGRGGKFSYICIG